MVKRNGKGTDESNPAPDLRDRVLADVEAVGAATSEPSEDLIGHTMFDQPGSEDGTLTVLVRREAMHLAASQALLRIVSKDGRTYLGVISAGPFAEPDSLKADSPILVTVATRGGNYLPPYHGRVQIELLGEELKGGTLTPPRLRPLPHSPVHRLGEEETAHVLKAEGDLRLGLAVGHESMQVRIPSDAKSVLPRHTAILGTTGGGKSTTVSNFVNQAQAAGMAVILLDVEGEYTHLHQPTEKEEMLTALRERGLPDTCVPHDRMTLYHLINRETANPDHPNRVEFSFQFARLSPYTVMEMLGLSDAQTDRYLFAYELAKSLLRELGVFPQSDANPEEQDRQERILRKLDEFDRGYPRLRLSHMLDVVGHCKAVVNKSDFAPFNDLFKSDAGRNAIKKHLKEKDMPKTASSWGKLYSLLWRLHRLGVLDRTEKRDDGSRTRILDYRELLRPDHLSVIDLSDAGMSELSNITMADLLRGVQETQETMFQQYEKAKRDGHPATPPPRVLMVIEEAHEFLSAERIDRMPLLYQQLARIAKRGRKRNIGLAFVTQLPQHLPKQIFGLVNSFVLHKISDPTVIASLKKTISDIDEGLWNRLPGLAPGQAIVSFPHMTRPLLVSVDPTPCKLRLVD